MSDLSRNSSFIPKHGPVKRKRAPASRQVYLFSLFTYVLIFAALLAAGGAYLYEQYVDQQLEDSVVDLYKDINSFSEADMEKVRVFDLRLQQATARVNNSASIVSLFETIELATAGTVEISSFKLSRDADESFLVKASIVTDSFDSTIFQRGVYERNGTIATSTIKAVKASVDGESQFGLDDSEISSVVFDVEMEIPIKFVPYTGLYLQETEAVPEISETPEATDDSILLDETSDNLENVQEDFSNNLDSL